MEPKLSFGIELEHILYFHEEEIIPILRSRNPLAYIEKSLEPQGAIAQALRHHGYESIHHKSWAIVGDGECCNSLDPSIRICKDGLDLARRCDHREALELAQKIVSKVPHFQSATTYYAPGYANHSDFTQ